MIFIKKQTAIHLSCFFKSVSVSSLAAIIIMSPFLFSAPQTAVNKLPTKIPYDEKTFNVHLHIKEPELSAMLIFSPSTESLKAMPPNKATAHRSLTLTLKNIKEMTDAVGGIDITSPLELKYPAGEGKILSSDTTHLFGDGVISLLSNESISSDIFYEIAVRLAGRYIKSFTKEKYLYLSEADTDISYTDYYDHKEEIEACHKNLYFK